MTGITEPGLLRAFHIVPWADCTDARRLDVHNGLLLSALWDAAFDRGLISFADEGTILANLNETARKALSLSEAPHLVGLRDAHRINLALHRTRNGFRAKLLEFFATLAPCLGNQAPWIAIPQCGGLSSYRMLSFWVAAKGNSIGKA